MAASGRVGEWLSRVLRRTPTTVVEHPMSEPGPAVLALIHPRLARPLDGTVVVIGRAGLELACSLANHAPDATVHILLGAKDVGTPLGDVPPHLRVGHCSTTTERRRYLRDIERPQVILEHGTKPQGRIRSFQHLFWALEDGGLYLTLALDTVEPGTPEQPTLLDHLHRARDLAALPVPERDALPARVAELAACVAAVEFVGSVAIVTKAGTHLYKLRHEEADEALDARLGDRWGATIAVLPAIEWTPRSRVTSHGDGPLLPATGPIQVPELRLRRYHDAVCHVRELTELDGYLLPHSFRRAHDRTLSHRWLTHADPHFDRPVSQIRDSTVRDVDGVFFGFDTAFPGHFGHLTTEVLGRVWGWRAALEHHPDLRPIMSLTDELETLPPFAVTMFTALGIPVEAIEYVREGESVRVGTLVAAMSQWENPPYVHPDMVAIWHELAVALAPHDRLAHDRIFVSRRPGWKRNCTATPAIEAFMVEHGVEVIYPEDLTYPEQVERFRSARIIAGFGGSGLFTMMANPRARVIVISSAAYDAANEYLFSAANGNDIHYFWGQTQVGTVFEDVVLDAYHSDFDFDLDRHRDALSELLT